MVDPSIAQQELLLEELLRRLEKADEATTKAKPSKFKSWKGVFFSSYALCFAATLGANMGQDHAKLLHDLSPVIIQMLIEFLKISLQ
ncbi:hypothetical protein [Halodesulfovibrio sp. MK-HDV]|uniref:hypothetical protein n=1 Tax=Halodesulfovibrio sp. MK-HDV TaxID=2599925 RepID=UPI00136D686C|nr:hypothetical protein [Halodesulfovibrio sp. MK-HDV]KAF1077639.1 hypothetical protein MKHDV_00095 [Halodesulfovibrio sp. MK-HDV]